MLIAEEFLNSFITLPAKQTSSCPIRLFLYPECYTMLHNSFHSLWCKTDIKTSHSRVSGIYKLVHISVNKLVYRGKRHCETQTDEQQIGKATFYLFLCDICICEQRMVLSAKQFVVDYIKWYINTISMKYICVNLNLTLLGSNQTWYDKGVTIIW